MKFTDFCDLAKKYPEERLQVFIDQSNLYKAIESQYPNDRLDYVKIASKLVVGRKLLRINIYLSTLNIEWDAEAAQKQQRFIYALQGLPLVNVKTRPLRYTSDRKRLGEKGIDILLATDMLSQAYAHGYDSLILISGDGDYAPVLEEIKKMGKRVENAFLKCDRSEALRSACDIFVDLDKKVLADCLVKKNIKKAGPTK